MIIVDCFIMYSYIVIQYKEMDESSLTLTHFENNFTDINQQWSDLRGLG